MTITERQALKPGTSLSLDGKKCMILGVMGAGTSCIAYKAQMKLMIKGQTALRTIVLKELYPAHQNIIRETDDSLIIPENSKALFEEESESFVKAAILQFEFHNEEDLANFTSDIEVVYELNKTLYSVSGIVSGKSYDKINPENITSILKVGESLSHAISYYHGRDYLNLDVKPSNIFYENLPGDNVAIKLFDFNTVCTKKEALQGKFSYSDRYAAPEVKAAKKGSGKLSEVGEQADIYSIGAVIFEKIMGRVPKAADQRKGKRWKFENNPYLKDVVPQLQKGITDLFRKTLAIDKKDRYSSAKELIETLEKLINLAGIKVFLKSQRISPCTPRNIYISRKDILSKISKALDEKHIIYLHALGGSGKSETAREYAEQYADKYDFIQSVFCSGSLKKTIANLDFVGLKDEDRFAHTDEDIDRLYNYKYGLLGNSDIYKANTLLIIDNYNPTSDEVIQNQEIISRLRDLHIHILFTTRVKPTDISECFDLENMFPEELRALFFRINPTDKDKSERIKLVDEIIKLSYNHTMTVKLVAMQSAEYMKPLEEYRDVLQEKGLNSEFESEIINEKDGRLVVEYSVYNHIRALFKLNDLKPKQKYIMVNACLLPLSGLEASTFSQYIDLAHFESSSGSDFLDPEIKKLVNSGWIEYADTSEKRFTAETKITLHPLICDIVTNELKPELTEDKCRKFYISFLDLIQEWGNKKVSNNIYKNREELVFTLFSNNNNLYQKGKLLQTINYIITHKHRFVIKNCSIISNNELIIYYGIEEKYRIDEGVKKISDKAFMECMFLKEVILPDSVIEIGSIAFMNCLSLLIISPLNNVVKIGRGAFAYCELLDNIILSDKITVIESGTFNGCCSLKKINIPNNVIEIGEYSFQNCSSLNSVIITSKINKICEGIFFGCSSMSEFVMPNSVISIGYGAFWGCKNLKNINIPNSVIEIGENAFAGCSQLTSVIIPSKTIKIGSGAFCGCDLLNEVILPDGLKKIESATFKDCLSINTIFIPNSIDEIGDLAFAGCTSLYYISIPNGVTKIGYKAFDGCICLKEIPIPQSVTKLGSVYLDLQSSVKIHPSLSLSEISVSDSLDKIESGFKNKLSNISIPYGTIEIHEREFSNYASLTTISIPSSVTIIRNCAFNNCKSLKKIFIPGNVKSIENRVFENCSLLNEAIISEGVTSLGELTFANCSSLYSINIPNSITFIDKCAFINCSSLESVSIPKKIIEIEEGIFYGCSLLRKVDIPENISTIKYKAFGGCSQLKEIVLPENITFIEPDAFDYEIVKCITILNYYIDLSNTKLGYFIDHDGIGKIHFINPIYHHDLSKSSIGHSIYDKGIYRVNNNLTIKGYKGSTAEQYAKEHGFKFVPLD